LVVGERYPGEAVHHYRLAFGTVTIAIILPDLCANPIDVVSYNNLYLHYDKTKVNSEGVEASFSIEVTGLADRLLSHVYDISLHLLVT
jgi:hypothetical protein